MAQPPNLQQVLASLAQFSQPVAQQSQPLQPRTIIDPATITVWSEGLRCVTKIAAQNKQFEDSIRKLMRAQRAREMQWYREKQNLKLVQANRNKSSAQALSILSSLSSAPAQSTDPAQVEVDAAKELKALQMRIYDEQKALQLDMSHELKALGVPFFGTKKELIREGDLKVAPSTVAAASTEAPASITRAELVALQKRIIDHLEALYRD